MPSQTELAETMSAVVYISKSRIERKTGLLRVAQLPGEPRDVVFSVHGAIAEHYKVDPSKKVCDEFCPEKSANEMVRRLNLPKVG
jgi:hypothetical protein